jgi:hypothetical protein
MGKPLQKDCRFLAGTSRHRRCSGWLARLARYDAFSSYMIGNIRSIWIVNSDRGILDLIVRIPPNLITHPYVLLSLLFGAHALFTTKTFLYCTCGLRKTLYLEFSSN